MCINNQGKSIFRVITIATLSLLPIISYSATSSIDLSAIRLKNIDVEEMEVINGVVATKWVHKQKENCAVTLFMNGIVRQVSFNKSDQRFTQGFIPDLATDSSSYSTSLDPEVNLYDLVRMEVENAPNCDQIIIAQSQGGLRATAYAQIMDQLGVGDRIKAIIFIGSPVRGWSALAGGVPALKTRMAENLINPIARAISSIDEISTSDPDYLITKARDQLQMYTKNILGSSADEALANKATDEMLELMSPAGTWAKTYMGIDSDYAFYPSQGSFYDVLQQINETSMSTDFTSNHPKLNKQSLLDLQDNSIYRKVIPSYIKIGFIVGDESSLGALAIGSSGRAFDNLLKNAKMIFDLVATLNRGAWLAENALSALKRADSAGAKIASINWNIAYHTARAVCFWWCDPSWMMDNANREWDKANQLWDEANYHESLVKRKWDAIGNAEASGTWLADLYLHLGKTYQTYTHDGLIPTYDQSRTVEEFGGQPISQPGYIKIVPATHIGNHDASQVGQSPEIWGTDKSAGWERPILSYDGIISEWYEENIRSAETIEEQNAWQLARYNIIVNY